MDNWPNIRAKIIKHVEENIGENVCDFGWGKGFIEHKKYKP